MLKRRKNFSINWGGGEAKKLKFFAKILKEKNWKFFLIKENPCLHHIILLDRLKHHSYLSFNQTL
jgi:hypothetical protein